MKTITEQTHRQAVDAILKERERLCAVRNETFRGMTSEEIQGELLNRFGGTYLVQRDRNIKFTKSDINAVANSRFYRKTGIKYLLGLGIILLIVAMLVNTFSVVPLIAGYSICAVVAIGFVYFYQRGQSKMRKELWNELGREESDEL